MCWVHVSNINIPEEALNACEALCQDQVGIRGWEHVGRTDVDVRLLGYMMETLSVESGSVGSCKTFQHSFVVSAITPCRHVSSGVVNYIGEKGEAGTGASRMPLFQGGASLGIAR